MIGRNGAQQAVKCVWPSLLPHVFALFRQRWMEEPEEPEEPEEEPWDGQALQVKVWGLLS
jgi:hypothetical protein